MTNAWSFFFEYHVFAHVNTILFMKNSCVKWQKYEQASHLSGMCLFCVFCLQLIKEAASFLSYVWALTVTVQRCERPCFWTRVAEMEQECSKGLEQKADDNMLWESLWGPRFNIRNFTLEVSFSCMFVVERNTPAPVFIRVCVEKVPLVGWAGRVF